jgi:hypothetical protein
MEQGPPPVRTKRGALERVIRDGTAFAAATRGFLPVSGRELIDPTLGSIDARPWYRDAGIGRGVVKEAVSAAKLFSRYT